MIETTGHVLADLDVQPSTGPWTWSLASNGKDRSGSARLEFDGRRIRWILNGLSVSAPDSGLHLEPLDPLVWHGFDVPTDPKAPGRWLPLPRRAVRSPYYADLLDLLASLTSPLQGGQVRRWARDPIPVTPSTALSGDLDLGDCWQEAVGVWNDGADAPLFRLETVFAEGVRLVHRPGELLHPPMWARVLRFDGERRPLLIHVVAGDAYDRPSVRRYAVRALVHELAHALQLWGHSLDPDHVLWRWGPIVDEPAPEERLALRWWRLLPEGLDLNRYGRSAEIDPERLQRQGPSVQELDLGAEGRRFGHGCSQLHGGAPRLPQAAHQEALQERG